MPLRKTDSGTAVIELELVGASASASSVLAADDTTPPPQRRGILPRSQSLADIELRSPRRLQRTPSSGSLVADEVAARAEVPSADDSSTILAAIEDPEAAAAVDQALQQGGTRFQKIFWGTLQAVSGLSVAAMVTLLAEEATVEGHPDHVAAFTSIVTSLAAVFGYIGLRREYATTPAIATASLMDRVKKVGVHALEGLAAAGTATFIGLTARDLAAYEQNKDEAMVTEAAMLAGVFAATSAVAMGFAKCSRRYADEQQERSARGNSCAIV